MGIKSVSQSFYKDSFHTLILRKRRRREIPGNRFLSIIRGEAWKELIESMKKTL